MSESLFADPALQSSVLLDVDASRDSLAAQPSVLSYDAVVAQAPEPEGDPRSATARHDAPEPTDAAEPAPQPRQQAPQSLRSAKPRREPGIAGSAFAPPRTQPTIPVAPPPAAAAFAPPVEMQVPMADLFAPPTSEPVIAAPPGMVQSGRGAPQRAGGKAAPRNSPGCLVLGALVCAAISYAVMPLGVLIIAVFMLTVFNGLKSDKDVSPSQIIAMSVPAGAAVVGMVLKLASG